MAKSASTSHPRGNGSTLQSAVYNVDVAEVRRLIKAGADVAAEIGHAEIIKLLLEAGANADSRIPTAALAAYLPARRACRVDPMLSVRTE